MNDDGVVNILDISLVSSCLGADPTGLAQCAIADTDGDGDIDMDDLNFVVAAFGQTGFPVGDVTPPVVVVDSPADGALFGSSPVTVSGTIDDDTATLEVNGVPATLSAGRFAATVPLSEGANSLTATATDPAGNVGTDSISVVLDTLAPVVAITSPLDGALVGSSPVTLSGTIDGDVATLEVNGVPATLSAGRFAATVPLSEGANSLTATATDPAGNVGTDSISVVLDTLAPVVTITSPLDGAVVTSTPISLSGTVDDDTASVTVNGVTVAVANGAFTLGGIGLAEGPNTLTATAIDTLGNAATDSIVVILELSAGDTTPPSLQITAPEAESVIFQSRPTIRLTYDDASGVDTATLALFANGASLAADCNLNLTSGTCTPTDDLPEGAVELEASIDDLVGNTALTGILFEVDGAPVGVTIATPEDGLITRSAQVDVTGTVDNDVQSVAINGVVASLSGTGFSATVPLREGTNMVVAVATNANNKTGTDSIDVTRDIVAPIVKINSPRNGFSSTNDVVTVTGLVNDIVNGATDPQVLVNGLAAQVSNGNFLFVDLPLVRGQNTIQVVATDAVGNQGQDSIDVTFQRPVGARISIASGNGQSGDVRSTLIDPIVAVITDDLGNPVAGKVVTFEVTRNSGALSPDGLVLPRRSIQVPTNGSGRASVVFSLGDTAGSGNNRVVAKALGVAGEVEYCATGIASTPDKILAAAGLTQRGTASQPLSEPLTALVVDGDGNPIGDLDVTFAVTEGGGTLDGNQSLTRRSGNDGVVRAVLTLGSEPGTNNNIVTASFVGLTALPATFVASAVAPGDPANTSLTGVVLDNGLNPIPGSVVSIDGTALTATTDDEGRFQLLGVPVGRLVLHIDPVLSPRPETFPPLEFETVTVAGVNNSIGQPILLPALATQGSKIVGGAQDVTLTMRGVPGLELTVFANSAQFPSGLSTGQLTISQVQLDKVPMPPPNGSLFMPPAWTIQPAGVRFDPPARISIPNDGLPPGRVIDIFQFDHALNEFINVGKGTASDDGLVIVSDPGFGITRSGWGGCGLPQPPQTCTKDGRTVPCRRGRPPPTPGTPPVPPTPTPTPSPGAGGSVILQPGLVCAAIGPTLIRGLLTTPGADAIHCQLSRRNEQNGDPLARLGYCSARETNCKDACLRICQNLSVQPGVIARASSTLAGFDVSSIIDARIGTSWFANTGDTSPFVEVEFPSSATVSEVRIFGNRDDFVDGFDIFEGRFELFDGANNLLFDSGVVTLSVPDGDFTLDVNTLSGVRRVRFTSTRHDGDTPGLSELAVIGTLGGAAITGPEACLARCESQNDRCLGLPELICPFE